MTSNRENSLLHGLIVALLDTVCLVSAYMVAVLVASGGRGVTDLALDNIQYVAVFFAGWLFETADQRLFVSRRGDPLLPQLFLYTKSVFMALVLSIFVLALLTPEGLDRLFAWTFCMATMVTMVSFRILFRFGIWGLRRRGYNYRGILLIGANERSEHIADIILAQRHYGYQIVGFLEDEERRRAYLERPEVPYLGKVETLEHVLRDNVVDVVYIALPVRSFYERVQSIAHLCEGVGVPVRLVADLFPLQVATSKLMRVAKIPLLDLSAGFEFQGVRALRRMSDALVSTFLILLLLPVLLIVAALVKLNTTGPILSGEARVSPRNGRPFKLYKFRTTATGNPADEPTRVGRFLRRYSLDELPELFNVWLGQISLMEPQLRYRLSEAAQQS